MVAAGHICWRASLVRWPGRRLARRREHRRAAQQQRQHRTGDQDAGEQEQRGGETAGGILQVADRVRPTNPPTAPMALISAMAAAAALPARNFPGSAQKGPRVP